MAAPLRTLPPPPPSHPPPPSPPTRMPSSPTSPPPALHPVQAASRKRPRTTDAPPSKRPRHTRVSQPRTTQHLQLLITQNALNFASQLPHNFLRIQQQQQAHIDANVREIVVDWMMEVATEYAANAHTLSLSINYLDRMLSKTHVTRASVQLVAVVCLMLACKMHECEAPTVAESVAMCDRSATHSMVLDMEYTILQTLNFNLNVPTASATVPPLIRQLFPPNHHGPALKLAHFLTHVALLDAEITWRSPGCIAVASVLMCLQAFRIPIRHALSIAQRAVQARMQSPDTLHAAVHIWNKWLKLFDDVVEHPTRWLLKQWPEHSPAHYCGSRVPSTVQFTRLLTRALNVPSRPASLRKAAPIIPLADETEPGGELSFSSSSSSSSSPSSTSSAYPDEAAEPTQHVRRCT
ncbi:hypothetical protein BWQ96_03061 [Gracilariopsis chorda]|uniref:Cyclin-like domain-containing protein n=1 Tax=Gracilariopsis chorda TaxID=448386 RepID=A0A2V3IYD6_9FLOR|nr:hypothetical protein BWQ96_03061 [Gracilariopsis chorda]|eukprot:PXF47119.1 hypothetical protein BWQ96_03061 [Gracilariopsis chorda]